MEIKRNGSQPSVKGPSEWFTWHGTDRSTFSGARSGTGSRRQGNFPAGRADGVAYPSARSDPDHNRRLRPGTALGRAGRGNPPGDVTWFAPGEKHWHGAIPTTAMTDIAIQEKLDGKVVDWMEQVSDEQYQDQ